MKSPAFQFYPDDFLGSGKVGMMTPQEVGIYILLLCLDWNDDGFELDFPRLARWCKTDEETLKGGWAMVGQCFDQHGGRWYSERLQGEREKQAKWREKSRNGGLKSGRTRGYPHKDPLATNEPPLNHPMNHLATIDQPPYEPFANTPTPTPTNYNSTAHAERFGNPDQLTAYQELRKAASLGTSFDAGLTAVALPPSGGQAYSWVTIGRALGDFYAANGAVRMTPAALRAFCRRIESDDARPADQLPRGTSKQERGRAALAETLRRRGYTKNGFDSSHHEISRPIFGTLPDPRHHESDS